MHCREYRLLSHLFLFGLTEDTLSPIQEFPELARHLPARFEGDEAAADHQHLFGFNIFPYESVFLDPSGQLGGDLSAAVVRDYKRSGYEFDPASGSPDHAGHEMALLAYLCRAETDAREQNDSELVAQINDLRSLFLERHLLRWLPPLVLAMGQQNHPFYEALAAMTLETVRASRALTAVPVELDFILPVPSLLLEDEKTSLADIVAFLLTPAYSGIYLSRDDIGRLASRRSLPSGFGERRHMLTDLFRSAANYAQLEQFLASLEELATSWADSYRQMDLSTEPFPEASVWGRRAIQTTTMLSEIRTKARALE
jgi:TorA maturation chaperone TorD